MPSEGVEWKPHDTMLRFEEIQRLCRIMVELGIRKIKVTGGEPLVRRGVTAFLNGLKSLPGIEKVTLTTNGLLLGVFLDESEIILDGVNISLDALDPKRYRQISRYEEIDPAMILSCIDRLLQKGVMVKLNCVPVSSFNEDEILPIAALAKDRNIAVRFIELMPLGSAEILLPIPGANIVALLEEAYGPLAPFSGIQGNGPAVYYSLPNFIGKIGFINALTQGFCETCNRLRLTSEGLLKPCLASELYLDLKKLLRSGASDKDIKQSVKEAVLRKPQFHSLSGVYGALVVEKHAIGMSRIGG
jgi:cyclic pyranopterin phosphate synthase